MASLKEIRQRLGWAEDQLQNMLGKAGGVESIPPPESSTLYHIRKARADLSEHIGEESEPSEHPHEPDGMTVVTERDFSTVDPSGWSDEDGDADWSIVTDQTGEPISPNTSGRIRFPAGFGGGTDPAASFGPSFSYAEIYHRIAFKVSSNWQGHDSGVNKIIFLSGENLGPGRPAYYAADGIDAGDLEFQVRLQGSNHGARNLGANVGSASDDVLTRGAWFEIEVHAVGNTPGTNDGECHVWINGTKTHEYTDVGWFASGDGPNFDSAKWEPTWGGTGDTVDETQYQYMGHWYMSSKA